MMVDPDSEAGVDIRSLLQGLVSSLPQEDIRVRGLCLDSRRVRPGDLFLALRGAYCDAAGFIDQAAENGACAALVESGGRGWTGGGAIPVFRVPGLRERAGHIASRFQDFPSRDLEVVGITGTNGKTSVCHFISQVLSRQVPGGVGCIGTLGYGLYPDLKAAVNTTPDALTLQAELAGFRRRAARWAVMEVSSHALEQGRVNGTEFDLAVFTNLSHEHLDYHHDMASYAAAKARLFQVPGLRQAVINRDDGFGRSLAEELAGRVPVLTYGLDGGPDPAADLRAAVQDQDTDGLTLAITSPWGRGQLRSPLIGRFNAYNLQAALAVLCLLGLSFETVLAELARVQPVPGRMEVFGRPGTARIVVDYAHTPDALEQALSRLRELCRGRLICVFGCGGGRDAAKRAPMGRIAEAWCDRVIITSDNPRDEMPEKIMDEIAAGMTGAVETLLDTDRTAAIRRALQEAGSGDVVLIAGKGHETYQEIAGRRYPFSDRQLVRNLLEEMA